MDWNPEKWKFSFRSLRDRWLLLLALGILFLLLSAPVEKREEEVPVSTVETDDSDGSTAVLSSKTEQTYEEKLEQRLKALLEAVEGVGCVDVMIVLKTSGEKVWQSDTASTTSLTQETDAGGGTRKVENRDSSAEVILAGEAGGEVPVLQKELKPEINGVIVSADGGGDPSVQADISQAVEALFGLPAHKVKVLKRAGS